MDCIIFAGKAKILFSCTAGMQLTGTFVFGYARGSLPPDMAELERLIKSCNYCGDSQLLETKQSIVSLIRSNRSNHIRKPTFKICGNKGADQLCSNCTADQRLCFRMNSTKVLLLIYKISSL